jgi:predicted nucleic acid-binding Zn ribbon protein
MSTWRPEASAEPQPLGASLDRLAARLGAGSARGLGALYERWEDIVGTAAAAHASPVGVRRGRLLVEVDHPAWGTSLAHLEATLLRRVAEVAGPDLVTGIEVRVRPG